MTLSYIDCTNNRIISFIYYNINKLLLDNNGVKLYIIFNKSAYPACHFSR